MRSLELRVPPLAVLLLAAAAMWLLARAFPFAALAFRTPYALAGALLGLGAAISVAGVIAFRRARTTVNPMDPAASTAIVSRGVYGFTRNPMYLGFLFALCGWALLVGHLLAVPVIAAFVAYMTRFQIVPEERALRAKFGPPYEDYLRRVRRWI